MKRRSPEDSKRSLALQGQLRCGPGAGFRQPAGRAGCDSAETLGRHGQGAGADHALAGALPGDRRERVDAGEAGGDPLENRACLAPGSASTLCKTGRTQQKPGHRPGFSFMPAGRTGAPPSGHGARGHRTRRVAAPLAPRARIQARTGQAGDFHGQQIVAGGDARAALMHDGGRIAARQQRRELGAQLLRRLEAAVGPQVLAVGAVQRAGMWPATGSMGSTSPR